MLVLSTFDGHSTTPLLQQLGVFQLYVLHEADLAAVWHSSATMSVPSKPPLSCARPLEKMVAAIVVQPFLLLQAPMMLPAGDYQRSVCSATSRDAKGKWLVL